MVYSFEDEADGDGNDDDVKVREKLIKLEICTVFFVCVGVWVCRQLNLCEKNNWYITITLDFRNDTQSDNVPKLFI